MTETGRKKTRETRDRLLDAAEDVFNTKGVSGTTLNDIAEAAGVTRGAIYWHFRNKTDLLNAMISRVRQPIREMIGELADNKTGDTLGSLGERSAYLMEQIRDNPHYHKVMSILYHKCEYTEAAGEILQYQQDWTVHVRDMMRRVLENAKDKGELPADIDIELAGLALHVIFNGLLNNWLLMPDAFDLVEDSKRLYTGIFSMFQNSPHMRVAARSAVPEKGNA